MTFRLNPAAATLAARHAASPGVAAAAQRIAAGTRTRALASSYRESVETSLTADGAWVGTDDPFAHLDEWGSINNPPTGAMRSAAAEAGRFVPD